MWTHNDIVYAAKSLLLDKWYNDNNKTIFSRPPPLCGAVPADNNYIAKPGDKVAARVKSSDGEENWILAEVSSFSTTTNKYEVDDIDAEEGKE